MGKPMLLRWRGRGRTTCETTISPALWPGIEQRQAAYEIVAHWLIGMLEVHKEKRDAILQRPRSSRGQARPRSPEPDTGHHAAANGGWKSARSGRLRAQDYLAYLAFANL